MFCETDVLDESPKAFLQTSTRSCTKFSSLQLNVNLSSFLDESKYFASESGPSENALGQLWRLS